MTRTPSAILSCIFGPIRVEIDQPDTDIPGKWVLTHLQKYSRCGFLLTWPFCFHIWFFWRKQIFNYVEGGWIPGTEQGIYIRTPGYRYDRDLGMKPTWGYCGLHWD